MGVDHKQSRHSRITANSQVPRLELHPAWQSFINHCRKLGYGEISNLKIQDGLPLMAEECVKKTKFI